MTERVFFFVGVAVQLAGVWLTIVGARTVWREIKSPDDRFLAPFIRAGRWVSQQWRRALHALGIPGPPQVVRIDASDVGVFGEDAKVVKSFGQLPAGLTTEQALQALDDRIREVQALAYEQAETVETRVRLEVGRLAEEQLQARQTAEETEQKERRTAVQGLRLEAYGFILLTAGTLVQAYGSYLGID